MSHSPVINVKGLKVELGKSLILNSITFKLYGGKIIGLLGPSGSGKTTLMRVLVGLQPPTRGNSIILGQFSGREELKTEVGYMTQSISIYPDLTVWENIRYFGSLMGCKKDELNQVLANVEMDSFKKRIVGTLSGGQKARVSLAVALLGNPKVLILDEPTVGLDPVLRKELWAQFRKLADQGRTLLISSHVMDEAEHCDEILLIREGKILTQATIKELEAQTKTKSVEEAFLYLVDNGGENV